MQPTTLEEAGAAALAEADRLFKLDIWDPPRGFHVPEAERWRDEISAMIVSRDGLGWHWEPRYEGDGSFEWCGAFASRAWAAAGLQLAERRTYWASCFRLHAWATYRRANEVVLNPRPDKGPHRLILELNEHSRGRPVVMPDGTPPRAGDILIVGGVNTGPGKHVTLIDHFDQVEGVFHTIEGNARGLGPGGDRRQGVVRATRPLGLKMLARGGLAPGVRATTYHARWIIRPAPSDLELAQP